jgi:hypothetical protein
MKDLVILVSDSDIEIGIKTLIEKRYNSLNIKQINFDIYKHPQRDPGVLKKAHEFLRPHISSYRYALVMFDYEGCGDEDKPIDELEAVVKERLENNGWERRCEVIILNPELEIWIWTESQQVAKVLNIAPRDLRDLIKDGKPKRPKEKMRECLRKSGIPWSSSLFKEIAEKISLTKCKDKSFEKFKTTLNSWFPQSK